MSGGQAAWRAPVARPPAGRARLVPTADGLTVRVPAAGATAGTLVRETGRPVDLNEIDLAVMRRAIEAIQQAGINEGSRAG